MEWTCHIASCKVCGVHILLRINKHERSVLLSSQLRFYFVKNHWITEKRMLTPSVINLVGRLINYSYSINVSPFYWDAELQLICECTSRSGAALRVLVYCAMGSTVVSGFEKVVSLTCRSCSIKLPNDPLILTTLVVYLMAVMMAITFGVCLFARKTSILNWGNRMLRYFKLAAGDAVCIFVPFRNLINF